MFSKNHPTIIFVDRNGFSLYQDTLANIPKFNFTPDLVANLDIVNKEQFANLIETFIRTNKIVPSDLAIVLSDSAVYTKDFPNNPNPAVDSLEEEIKKQIQGFLDNVPFEDLLAKVIKIGQTDRIAVANKDLIMTIADAFIKNGATLEAVIPGFLFGPTNFAMGLSQENAHAVLIETEIMKQGNMLTNQETLNSPQAARPEKEKEKKPRNKRQYLLIGVFIIFLVILAVAYLSSRTSQNQPVKKIDNSSVGTTGSVSIAPSVIPTPTITSLTATPAADLKPIK